MSSCVKIEENVSGKQYIGGEQHIGGHVAAGDNNNNETSDNNETTTRQATTTRQQRDKRGFLSTISRPIFEAVLKKNDAVLFHPRQACQRL